MEFLGGPSPDLNQTGTIQATQMSLERWQREVGELEQRLMHAKLQCALLTEELHAYALQDWNWSTTDQPQVTTTTADERRPTSLIDFPDELLCDVFEYATYLLHPSIRSLLLVCKRFHSVIMGTSSLWTRVDVIFPDDITRRSFLTKDYVRACLDRSCGRLLDITFKLPRHITALGYTLSRVVKSMTPLVGRTRAKELENIIYDTDWSPEVPCVTKNVNHIRGMARSLIGINGEHILRWASLALTLPQEPYENPLLVHLEERLAPNLQRLEVMNARYMDNWAYLDEFGDDKPSFLKMPSLYSLKMDCLCLDSFTPSESLTHLDVKYGFSLSVYLRAMQQLHHLCIRNATNLPYYDEDPVFLPCLSDLRIYGQGDQILGALVTPQLKVLFVQSSQTSVAQPLPSVPSIEWSFDTSGVKEKLELSQRDALSSILGKMTATTRCLSLQGFPVEMVDELANRLKRDGGIPTSLKIVEVLMDDTRTTVCDWDMVNPI